MVARATGPGPEVRARAAVEAARAVAAAHGLHAQTPRVLRNASNVLVHLHPHPLVARVTGATGAVRPGTAWRARELAVAGALAVRGAPVVPPADLLPPGPHVHAGLALSFWPYLPPAAGGVDPTAAGRALRRCHDGLAALDLELPVLGLLDEAEALLAGPVRAHLHPSDGALLRRALRRGREAPHLHAVPLQPLHGDAHLDNVLAAADGPRWNDWEDAQRGPVAWDLACMLAPAVLFDEDHTRTQAALEAWGAPPDEALLGDLVAARAAQVVAWRLVLAPHAARSRRRNAASLAWLRAHEEGAGDA